MASAKQASPCLVVIFGASGDLTKRKLIPSLYDLYCEGDLPKNFTVLGVSRTAFSDEAFREHLTEPLKEFANDFDEANWRDFAPLIHYHVADPTRTDDFPGLKQRMEKVREAHGSGENVLFYLSLAPHLYDPVIVNIGAAGMVTEGKAWCSINRTARPWQRIIVEKPFGHDPDSAAHLNRVLGRVFEEEDTYRIDHYLGKETVQNLLVFRFANTIFEPIWNRSYIDHVQVTAAESVGVEGRGSYYDSPSGGAMRDMIQSHLLQVMAVVAMEPPVSMRARDIRVEQTKVLAATAAPTAEQVPQIAVRGQYGPGSINGKPAPGYREEKGTDEQSQTDTYAAMQLSVDTWRWGGVPFYIRTGKRLPRKTTQIVVQFKPTPHPLFRGKLQQMLAPNQIVINVQPDEGIHIRFEGKVPGVEMDVRSVNMHFNYVEQFHGKPPQAYAKMLLDAVNGDQTLFKHREEIEHAWKIVQPVLDYWDAHPDDNLPNYAAGSWGPKASDEMLGRGGRAWYNGDVGGEGDFEI